MLKFRVDRRIIRICFGFALLERFSSECRKELHVCFGFALSHSDWLAKFAPLSQALKTELNQL